MCKSTKERQNHANLLVIQKKKKKKKKKLFSDWFNIMGIF
jgi:hypothetical protein